MTLAKEMNIRIAALIMFPWLFCQEAGAIGLYHAFIDTIRGKVVSIDTKTGFLVDGYTIEVDQGIDPKALAKIRSALISNTRHEYRKFERPSRGQILLLVRKTDKPKVGVGDTIEIQEYGIVNSSENGSKDGNPSFKSFTKVKPIKKNG